MRDWVEEYLELPLSKRQNIRLGKKGYQKQTYRPQRRLSREQVVMFLIEHKITSQTKLKQYQDYPDAPGYYHIRKYFSPKYDYSCWDVARREIFRLEKQRGNPFSYSPKSVINAIQHFNIRSLEQYCQYRKRDKELFPSKHTLYRIFGSFNNVKRIIQSMEPNSIIARYVSLKIRLGRFPTKKECRENGVEIDNLKMSREQLRWTVRLLENPKKFIERTIR